MIRTPLFLACRRKIPLSYSRTISGPYGFWKFLSSFARPNSHKPLVFNFKPMEDYLSSFAFLSSLLPSIWSFINIISQPCGDHQALSIHTRKFRPHALPSSSFYSYSYPRLSSRIIFFFISRFEVSNALSLFLRCIALLFISFTEQSSFLPPFYRYNWFLFESWICTWQQFTIVAFPSFANTPLNVISSVVLANFSNPRIFFRALRLPLYRLLQTLNAFHSSLSFSFRFRFARIDCSSFVIVF